MRYTVTLLAAGIACGVIAAATGESCSSMRDWYPGVEPRPITGGTPYKLFVTSFVPDGRYNIGSVHNVTLMGNSTAEGNGTFVGFIIYAKAQYPEDSSSRGEFMKPLPEGIEMTECTDGYKFEVARNSSYRQQTAVHLRWKAPAKETVGKITFSASVAVSAGVYYEGFKYVLTYNCIMYKCIPAENCLHGIAMDKNGCRHCKCAAPMCASLRGWYPDVGPTPVTDKSPYKLFVTSSDKGYEDGLYILGTVHNVILMRNNSEGDNGTFWGFVIYAKVQYPEDSSSRGEFMKPLPEGIEMTECTDGYKFEVARNSSYQQQTEVHLRWKAPTKEPMGKITFSASVAESAEVYYDGLTYVLTYNCPVPSCHIPGGCPNGLARDKHGCITCECAGASTIALAFSCLVGMLVLLGQQLM